jgi:hypothetical protein
MALIFAFFAVRAAHRTNIQQGRQLRALEEDRSQAQAAKVAVWCTGDAGEVPACLIRNSSELPIFGIVVCAVVTDVRGKSHGRWWRLQEVEPRIAPPGTVEVRFDRSGLGEDVELHSKRAQPPCTSATRRESGGVGLLAERLRNSRTSVRFSHVRWLTTEIRG